MDFGSWSYTQNRIDIYPMKEELLLENFIPDEEWEVLSFTLTRKVVLYQCCEIPYTVLTGEIVMKRKALYYIVNLVIPTVIISEISFIGFFTPSAGNGDRIEKTTLGMGTIMAMAIMLVMVDNNMPATSDYVPLIAWFFIMAMLLIAGGVGLASVIMCIHRKGRTRQRMSPKIRALFFFRIAPLLRVHVPKRRARFNHNLKPRQNEANNHTSGVGNRTVDTDSSHSSPLLDKKQSLKESVDQMVVHLREQSRTELEIKEWEVLAEIIDRLMLVLFSTALAILTTAVLSAGAIMG